MKRNNTSITAVSSPRNNKRGPVKEISSIRGLINSRSGGLIKTRLNLSVDPISFKHSGSLREEFVFCERERASKDG